MVLSDQEAMRVIPFFLLSLRLSGIKNIDIPVEFQFYKKTIKNDFNPDDFRIKAIYGENGSGKTAIITAMKILGDLINNENYLYDSVSQRNLLELINKKTQAGQIEVEYYVNTENHSAIYKYQVAFKVGKDYRVHLTGEKLEVKKGTNSQNRYITVYRVQDGELIEFCNDDLYKKHKETTQNLLSQRTFASFLPDAQCSRRSATSRSRARRRRT